MYIPMAVDAKRYQVLLDVTAATTAELSVMNLEIGHRSAILTSPAVTLQHLTMQLSIGIRIESQSRLF